MKKFFSLLRPFTGTLILSIVFSTINTVLELLMPQYTKKIMSDGILKGNMDNIKYYGALMLAFTALGLAASVLNTYFSTKTSVNYSISLRNYIFGKVSHLSAGDIDNIGVASLVTRTTNDANAIHEVILNSLKSIVPIPVMFIGGVILAYNTNPELSKIIIWAILFLLLFAGVLMIIIIPMYSKVQKLLDRLNQIMREKISGIRVVRAFNKTEHEDSRFADTNKKLTGLSLKAQRILACLLPLVTVILYGLLAFIISKCVDTANGMNQDDPLLKETIPNMYMFISYFVLVISAITSLIGIISSIPRATISGKRIMAILNAVSDIKEPENPVTPDEKDRGTVEFRNVSFKYKPPKEEPVKKKKNPFSKKRPEETKKRAHNPDFMLSDISFKSHPGEITAIIGITGSGKSTVMNLIPRLYDATEGEVLVAGVNVKELSGAELSKRISVIPQQAFLFSGSIADNIRYGREDATDAEIWHALEIAQASSFVANMPEGIESFVSQAGKNFSGGQKQRLAIARAIAKGSEILLFDDSFSALDLATDARLRASLKANLTDTNIIIVAQRVGTVINADRILVMDGGRVVGQGTHKELLKSCETYREIVETQLSKEAVEEAEA